jgi:hypothetical protein
MSRTISLVGRAAALLACTTMIATPAMARRVPLNIPLTARPAAVAAWSGDLETYNDHRRYRYRHHDGIDGGDLLGGLLVLGGIAAVAAAIDKSNSEKTRGEDYRNPRQPDYGNRDYDYRDSRRALPPQDRYGSGRAGEFRPDEARRAADACAAEAGRDGRVAGIDGVEKSGQDWRVRGSYAGGSDFSCTVDREGHAWVGKGAGLNDSDRSERDVDGTPDRYDEQDAYPRAVPQSGNDDRYQTGNTPDFEAAPAA